MEKSVCLSHPDARHSSFASKYLPHHPSAVQKKRRKRAFYPMNCDFVLQLLSYQASPQQGHIAYNHPNDD
eukprot:4199535-Prorocentrum_lima.AAC.1